MLPVMTAREQNYHRLRNCQSGGPQAPGRGTGVPKDHVPELHRLPPARPPRPAGTPPEAGEPPPAPFRPLPGRRGRWEVAGNASLMLLEGGAQTQPLPAGREPLVLRKGTAAPHRPLSLQEP